MKDRVVLEQRVFPSREAACAALRDLYRDRWPTMITETAHERVFLMEGLLAAGRCRDPDFATVSKTVLGLDLEQTDAYRKMTNVGGMTRMVCLQHSWALENLSTWLSQSYCPDHPPTIVHVDAHDDLQTPNIAVTEDPMVYLAPCGDAVMDLRQPETVAPFIDRGFIGIGGFLVPFLRSVGSGRFIHLVPEDSQVPVRRGRIAIEEEAFVHLAGRIVRPRAGVVPETPQDGCGFEHVAESRLDVLEEAPQDSPVLLDIDLDYFCNHFDDSAACRMVEPGELMESVARFSERLQRILETRRIELVTVACSPNFFPAGLWLETLRAMDSLLALPLPFSRSARHPSSDPRGL